MQINRESFAAYNHDVRGIRFKFEDLCRQLFSSENLSGNKQFKYLHANPNNHGLETEPIKHSTEKIVEYYTGKERVIDLVIEFREIIRKREIEKEIVKILHATTGRWVLL